MSKTVNKFKGNRFFVHSLFGLTSAAFLGLSALVSANYAHKVSVTEAYVHQVLAERQVDYPALDKVIGKFAAQAQTSSKVLAQR